MWFLSGCDEYLPPCHAWGIQQCIADPWIVEGMRGTGKTTLCSILQKVGGTLGHHCHYFVRMHVLNLLPRITICAEALRRSCFGCQTLSGWICWRRSLVVSTSILTRSPASQTTKRLSNAARQGSRDRDMIPNTRKSLAIEIFKIFFIGIYSWSNMCERYEKATATWLADSKVVWRRLWQTAWRLQKVKSSPKAFGPLVSFPEMFFQKTSCLRGLSNRYRPVRHKSARGGRWGGVEEKTNVTRRVFFWNKNSEQGKSEQAFSSNNNKVYQKISEDLARCHLLDYFPFFFSLLEAVMMCIDLLDYFSLFLHAFASIVWNLVCVCVCPKRFPNVLPSRIPWLQRNWAKGTKWSTLTGHRLDPSWFTVNI